MRLLALAIVVLVAGSARADHAPPLVSWRAPAGCGDEAAIRARIMARVGRSVADGKEPYAIVEVEVDGDGVVAVIALTTPHAQTETRRRRGSCDEVADALAGLVANAGTS